MSISDLAELVRDVVGYAGEIVYDATKPDGMPRKLLDVNRLRDLGWEAKTSLREGVERTYAWFLHSDRIAGRTFSGFAPEKLSAGSGKG